MKLRTRQSVPLHSNAKRLTSKPSKRVKPKTNKPAHELTNRASTLTSLPVELEGLMIEYLSDLDLVQMMLAAIGFEATQIEIARYVQLHRATPTSLVQWARPTFEIKCDFVRTTIRSLFGRDDGLSLRDWIDVGPESAPSMNWDGTRVFDVAIHKGEHESHYHWSMLDLNTTEEESGTFGTVYGPPNEHDHFVCGTFVTPSTVLSTVCTGESHLPVLFDTETMQSLFGVPSNMICTDNDRWIVSSRPHHVTIYDRESDQVNTPRTTYHFYQSAFSLLMSMDCSRLVLCDADWPEHRIIRLHEDHLPADGHLHAAHEVIAKRNPTEFVCIFYPDCSWVGIWSGKDAGNLGTETSLVRCTPEGHRTVVWRNKGLLVLNTQHSENGRWLAVSLMPGNRFMLFDMHKDELAGDFVEDQWEEGRVASVSNDGSMLIREDSSYVVYHSVRGRICVFHECNSVTMSHNGETLMAVRGQEHTEPTLHRLLR